MNHLRIRIGLVFGLAAVLAGGWAPCNRTFGAAEEQSPERIAWTLEAIQGEWGPKQGFTWVDTGEHSDGSGNHTWAGTNPGSHPYSIFAIGVEEDIAEITLMVAINQEDTNVDVVTYFAKSVSRIGQMTGLNPERVSTWMGWCLADAIAAWSEEGNGPKHAIEMGGYRLVWQDMNVGVQGVVVYMHIIPIGKG